MGLLEKIKEAFSNKSLPEEKVTEDQFRQRIPHSGKAITKLESEILTVSDSSYLVSTASRISVGLDPIMEITQRLGHISKIVGMGHESVLEHTNITMMLHIPVKDISPDFVEFTSGLHYLHFKQYTSDDNVIHLLIGGSIRAYKYMIRTIKDVTHNVFAMEVINNLYQTTYSVFYNDLINDGIMDERRFKVVAIDDITHTILKDKTVTVLETENSRISILYNKVKQYGFTMEDLFDFVTVSVIFSNISRPISMQIIRHRNAITQESQRYVDYSDKSFIDPNKFLNCQDTRYHISLFGTNNELTAGKLGNKLCSIYKQLIDQGMQKQNARSFLPSNVCTKLIMTFTYTNLMKFIDLRDAKSAQLEVQEVAKSLKKVFFNKYETIPNFEEILRRSLTPRYNLEKINFDNLNNTIDEVLEEEVLEDH